MAFARPPAIIKSAAATTPMVSGLFVMMVLPNPPLTTDNVHGATLEAPCDLRALLRDFRPRLTPLAEGLRRTLAA